MKTNQRPGIKDKTDKLLKLYVSASDYDMVKADFAASGHRSLSAYLRRRLTGKGIVIHQPKELLARLDALGAEIGRIGNNINQMAKMANLMEKEGILPIAVIREFNDLMTDYILVSKELSKAYRGLLRNMA